MSKVDITPLGDKLLIRRDQVKKRASGIILAEEREYLINKGTVEVVGKDVEGISPGDYILYEQYSGTPVKVNGEEKVILPQSVVMAVLEKDG